MAGPRYHHYYIGSLVVKGLNKTFVDMSALLVISQPTYVGLVYYNIITVWRISVLKGFNLKLTCMNESGPVLLVP